MLVKQAGALQHSTVGVLSEHGAYSFNVSSTQTHPDPLGSNQAERSIGRKASGTKCGLNWMDSE